MTAAPRVPLTTEDAARTVAHVNEDHLSELLLAVRAFTGCAAPQDARITALYPDGLDVEVQSAGGQTQHFIAFTLDAPPHEAIRATVMEGMRRLGELPRVRSLVWEVLEVRFHTPHIRRLTFRADPLTLEDWQPGYACRFALTDDPDGSSRPYTLRRADPRSAQVEVDVYCHDETPGSRWAAGVRPGQHLPLIAGRREVMPDFSVGGALLLGDETALPTLGALLEGWAHGQPPRVLLEVNAPAEGRYLDDVTLPPGTQVTCLTRAGDPGEALRRAVQASEAPVRAVWGALEAGAAKRVRTHLRAEHGLTPAQCRVLGYWREDDE